MGFFTDLLGGSGKTREIGGGFDPAIKPYIESGLTALERQYLEGPRVFRGERVAGFDPTQLAAQSSLLALSTAQPDYYRTALGGLEEAIGMQRQAATGITIEDIARQREILEPTAEAQRMAQEQAFRRAIRDIGVGAGGAGVGALEGARADILRSGAAGELAIGMADIEGQLQRQALQQAEADRARQAAGAGALAQLAGQRLGVGQAGFGEQIERIGLGADVGQQRRALEQARIGAEMAEFLEADPFSFTQRYLQTVYGAPTRQTQYSQDPSTFQELVGLGSIGASLFKEGGTVNKEAGGALLKLMMSAGGNKKKSVDESMDMIGPTILNEGGGILSKLKSMYNKTRFSNDMTKEEEEELKDIEDFSDEKFGTDYASEREAGGSKISPANAMASVGATRYNPDDSVMFAKQRAARQALAMRQNGGGIASLQVGGVPAPMPRPNIQQQPNALQRIMSGVGSGLRSIGSGIGRGVSYYSQNLDPFGPAGANLTRAERIRVGLGILAAQPTLGESPLTTTARGALLAIEDLPEAETVTPRISPVPAGEFDVIDEGILGLQKSRTKAEADQRNQLRIEAEREAIQGIYEGRISNDQASYRNAVKEIYTNKMNKFLTVDSSGSGATGVSGAGTAPAGKGSTSSGIAAITKPTS